MIHPLAELIRGATQGRYPAADGSWQRVPTWRAGLEAVVAFTGHAVLAVGHDVDEARLQRLGVDGFGGAHHPRVIVDLAGPGGWVDSLDVLLVARGTGGASERALIERPDKSDHPRVAFARALRDEVRVLGLPVRDLDAIVIVARGIAGLPEFSLEIGPEHRGAGLGTSLVLGALARLSPTEIAVASVAPGNAASLRTFLRSGFAPIGSVQLLRPERGSS